MKLTKIFPPDVLPVRSGVYRTKAVDIETGKSLGSWGYSYFDTTSKIWGCAHPDVDSAARVPDYEFALQHKMWRGLAEEPKS